MLYVIMADSGGSDLSKDGIVLFSRQLGVGSEDDWDDTALIEAYDQAVGGIYKELDKRKATKKWSGPRKWKIGEYCRSKYDEDGLWYEAQIISIKKDMCTVQYLGYLNEEEKHIKSLKESSGEKCRQQQIADAKAFEGNEDEMATDGTTSPSHYFDRNAKSNDLNRASTDSAVPSSSGVRDRLSVLSTDKANAQSTASMLYRSLKDSEQEHRKRGAFFQDGGPGLAFPPPPPPFPPGVDEICSSDEALAAMLMSWYISGYHTGYYQAMRQTGRS